MAVLSQRASGSEAHRDTRATLMAATGSILGEGRAFAELSVAEIVLRAGVSRPTFYAYFRDKRDLVLALGADFEAAAHEAAAPWLEMREDDVRTALRAVLETFRAHQVTIRAITEAAGYDDDVAAFWRRFHERFIVNVVQRAAPPPAEATAVEARAFTLIWMTERSIYEHLNAPRVGDEDLLDALEHQWRATLDAGGGR